MKLIVGLGNPGKQYENTKHNMGFLALDRFLKEHPAGAARSQFESITKELQLSGQKVLLLKPQTYMNASGRAVRKAMDYYRLDLMDLIVLYDDIDLPLGKLRIRKSGGPGTHNGMRDIVQALGSDDFARMRLGVGADQSGDLVHHVLSGFRKEEIPEIESLLSKTSEALSDWLERGIDIAMNRHNG